MSTSSSTIYGHHKQLIAQIAIVFMASILTAMIITMFSKRPDHDVEAPQEDVMYNKDDFISLFVSVYGEDRLLEEQCFEDQECLQIRDKVLTYNGRSRILRAAVKEGLNKKTSLFTFAYLKFPQKLVRSALDSSKWKIDFDVAPQGGPLIMANEIFKSGSVSRADTANTHVVVMGLGGGFISGYLHHHFPQMRITAVDISPTVVSMAKKWFSMETDNRYDIVVEDGVQYFRRCVEQGVLTINFLARLKTLKDEVLNTFHKYFKYEKPTALGKSPNYIHTFTQFEPPRQLEDTNMNKSKA